CHSPARPLARQPPPPYTNPAAPEVRLMAPRMPLVVYLAVHLTSFLLSCVLGPLRGHPLAVSALGGPAPGPPNLLLIGLLTLPQRPDRVPGLSPGPATAEAPPEPEDPTAPRLRQPQERVATGFDDHTLLDGTVRQLADVTSPADEAAVMPTLLTSRARRVLER